MEAFAQGGPCDTTATSTDATSTPPPGPVEPTVAMDPIAGRGLLDRGDPELVGGGGTRGSLHLRSASLADANRPVRSAVGGAVETPTVGEGWQSSFSVYSAGGDERGPRGSDEDRSALRHRPRHPRPAPGPPGAHHATAHHAHLSSRARHRLPPRPSAGALARGPDPPVRGVGVGAVLLVADSCWRPPGRGHLVRAGEGHAQPAVPPPHGRHRRPLCRLVPCRPERRSQPQRVAPGRGRLGGLVGVPGHRAHPPRRLRRGPPRRRRPRRGGRRVRGDGLRDHGPGAPQGQGGPTPQLLQGQRLVGPPSELSGAAPRHDV